MENILNEQPQAIDKLTPKQKFFLNYYIQNGFNGALAYRAMNPNCKLSTAKVNASKLLANVDLQTAIAEICGNILKEGIAILELRIRHELESIAFSDIRNISDFGPKGVELYDSKNVDTRAVKSIKCLRDPKTGNWMVEVKMHDKLKALNMLAKILGMYSKKEEQQRNIIYVEAPGTRAWLEGDHSNELQ